MKAHLFIAREPRLSVPEVVQIALARVGGRALNESLKNKEAARQAKIGAAINWVSYKAKEESLGWRAKLPWNLVRLYRERSSYRSHTKTIDRMIQKSEQEELRVSSQLKKGENVSRMIKEGLEMLKDASEFDRNELVNCLTTNLNNSIKRYTEKSVAQ